ncbi:MAG: 4Fe-4S dicluster domain-containing protein [Aquificaceae bacterium]
MIRLNLDLCSGCRRCMLACSFYTKGGFNPRLSSIEIKTDIGNKPTAYKLSYCKDCKGFYCIDFCFLNALEFIK